MIMIISIVARSIISIGITGGRHPRALGLAGGLGGGLPEEVSYDTI